MSGKKRETSAKFKGSSLFQHGIQMKYRKEKKKTSEAITVYFVSSIPSMIMWST